MANGITDFFQAGITRVLGQLVAGGLIRTLNSMDRSDPERDAEIHDMCGNSFPKQIQEFEKLISDGLAKNLNQTILQLADQRLQTKYQDIHENLHAIQRSLNAFLQHTCQAMWDDFERVFKDNDPGASKDTLFDWITNETKSVSQRELAVTLVDTCKGDVATFRKWQVDICLKFALVYNLQASYYFFQTFPDDRYSPKSRTVAQTSDWDTELPDYVPGKLSDTEKKLTQVIFILEEAYQKVKTSFLFTPCGDSRHKNHCGADNDGQCCLLNSIIYKRLRDEKVLDNTKLASYIASDLRSNELLNHLIWSVVVFPDYKSAEVQLNHEYYSDIWFQRSGTKQVIQFSPERERSVMFQGLRSYGCFLCYRIKTSWEKAALVFWADKEKMPKDTFENECAKLSSKWESDEDYRKNCGNKLGSGSIYRATSWTKELGMNFVFGAGLRAKTTTQDIGWDLAPHGSGQFPLCFGNGESCILLWLAPSSNLEVRFTNFKFTQNTESISTGGGTKPYVTKRHLDDTTGIPVAVKAIPLSMDQENQSKKIEREKQIAELERRFQHLKHIDHENIVKFIGSQPIEPANTIIPPTYIVVMEFCSGETLTKTVLKPITLRQLFDWSHGIVSGLDYLHSHVNIAHEALHGNHLIIKPGPENQGSGTINIISVGQLTKALGHVKRTYDARENKSLVAFMPLETDKKKGSKSDIWSFGCILMLMILGAWSEEDLKRSNDAMTKDGTPVKIPRLKDGVDIPHVLQEVIDHCLAADYDNRPSAVTILGRRIFEREEFKQLSWMCPTRFA